MKRTHHFCNIHTPDDDRRLGRKTREIISYGKFINPFSPDIIKSIRQLERINKKYVDKKCR